MARTPPILHPTDFSRPSAVAFRAAVDWARRTRADVVLAHVVAPPAFALEDSYLTPRTYGELAAAVRREAQHRLVALVRRARGAGVRARPLLLDGAPAEQIARAARRERASLIVIGTHGRTGLRRVLLGSVAARVIALASCPVLSLRG